MKKLTATNGKCKGIPFAKRQDYREAFERRKGDETWHDTEDRPSKRECIVAAALEYQSEMPFPLQVFPLSIQRYIEAWGKSLYCSFDLLALPLLGVAGAAIARAGGCLQVNESWTESSCLWVVGIAPSSEGKTPALNAVSGFYLDKQKAEDQKWREAKRAHEDDPDSNPKPGQRPQLFLTDTTLEGLRYVLAAGPTLYQSDELASWCQQMSQYKAGNADKPAWTSFWSHSPVSVGRRSDSLYVHYPVVSVSGMLVPESVPSLNYRGHGDDGFVHRMLIAYPASSRPVFTNIAVPPEMTDEYNRHMTRLFQPGATTLRVDTRALSAAAVWVNQVHYPEVSGNAPDWLVAKYKKLVTNLWRIALVLHELRRVAETPEEREGREFDPLVVDGETIERAIAVVNYFKDHIPRVQTLLRDEPLDDCDALYRRFCARGQMTVREFMLNTSYKKADQARAFFAKWENRGYGKATVGNRKDQTLFVFGAGGANSY